VLDGLDGLHDLLDEPLGDVSLVPMALLARFARPTVTVALAGTGSDEVFAGHAVYRAHRFARAWHRLPAPVRVALSAVAGRATDPFVNTAGLETIERHATWMAACVPGDVRALLTADALARLSAPPSYGASHQIAAGAADADWLHQLLYLDLKGHLAEGALQALDRGSLASSLQVRVPLLDRRVVEVAAVLPPRMMLRGLRTKHIFRRTLRGRVPAAVLARPPKALDLPLARWFRGELGERLRAACDTPLLGRDALLRRDAVERLLEEHRHGRVDHARALYTLLALLAWAHRHGAA
jgi:asparagine synthase (glutamine-hydrolysing)